MTLDSILTKWRSQGAEGQPSLHPAGSGPNRPGQGQNGGQALLHPPMALIPAPILSHPTGGFQDPAGRADCSKQSAAQLPSGAAHAK